MAPSLKNCWYVKRTCRYCFKTAQQAEAYLDSQLFITDVVEALKPYLNSAPDVRIYTVA